MRSLAATNQPITGLASILPLLYTGSSKALEYIRANPDLKTAVKAALRDGAVALAKRMGVNKQAVDQIMTNLIGATILNLRKPRTSSGLKLGTILHNLVSIGAINSEGQLIIHEHHEKSTAQGTQAYSVLHLPKQPKIKT